MNPLKIYIHTRTICNDVSVCDAHTPVFVYRHGVLSLGYNHRTDGHTEMYVMNKYCAFGWCNYRVFDKDGNELSGPQNAGNFLTS